MRTSLFLAFAVMSVAVPLGDNARAIPVPFAPNTAREETHLPESPGAYTSAPFYAEHAPDPTDFPTSLSIPSIKLTSPVTGLGVNGAGEMDVPSGATNDVGWYAPGTVPGDLGSAVMDAHVYAAFKNLRHVSPGDDVFVTNGRGETLRFRVTDTRIYPRDEVPLQHLFAAADGRHLNLITCAKKYLPLLGTYSHRLVVYTTLVED
jgi:LPXTG-site transpeptidase (sortase) family protein